MSIDAQRRDLAVMAKKQGRQIVAEFVDAVESGKDEDREGFQTLLRAIRNPRRGWDTLYVLDTSRIARRRHIAIVFEEVECKRHGVKVVYRSLPDSDPITEMLLKSILQAMDEWHSLTSRQKGLAGMRENVRQGFRAGGRAPIGYKLEHVDTGALREGQPVRKSRLVPSADAPAVRAYLQARASGTPRARAGLPQVSPSSLVGVEWNALTYAGHTVWNVHAEAGSGRKRRPRSEWVIQRDTHEALITEEQADVIIASLERYSHKRARNREAGYLLTGLLVAPDGRSFEGDRGAYRVKGRQVRAELVDRAVAEQVMTDIQAPAFVRAVTKAAKATSHTDTAGEARAGLADCEARLSRILSLLEQTTAPGPLLRQMEAIEAERAGLAESIEAADREAAEAAAMSRITEHEVRRILVERAAAIREAPPETMRDVLASLLSKVELDGDELRVHYRIGSPGNSSGRPRAGPPPLSTGLSSAPRGDAILTRRIAAISVVRTRKIA